MKPRRFLPGTGRFEAAKLRGLEQIPAIRLRGLSEAKKRALLLADNKIAESAGWDRERLAIELPELADLLIEENLDISITGFEPAEIDYARRVTSKKARQTQRMTSKLTGFLLRP